MHKKTIYGPPGTGKTTYLLDLVEQELRRVKPSELAFVSFTKAGTYEGLGRAKQRFKLGKSELPYFRTIHSLCFAALGLRRDDIVGEEHYKRFSERTGISFTGFYTQDFTSMNDLYLHAIAMELHNPALAFKMAEPLNRQKYRYIRANYAAMKKQLGVMDFDDMLVRYLERGSPLDVKVAIVDEAQDLTPLQWKVAMKMFSNCERMYVAGDDDQTVYEWAGADVRCFLRFSQDYTVLNKSYRLPASVLSLASKVSADIAVRQEKQFVHNGSQGIVDHYASLKHVPLNGGELVLARTNSILRLLANQLEDRGLPYTLKGKASLTTTMRSAIETYTKFRLGQATEHDLKKFSAYFVDVSLEKPCWDVLNVPVSKRLYWERMYNEGAVFNKPVALQTFHGSKGTESDHVIVTPAISETVYDNLEANRDSELRCLYVGVTRARQRLTILGNAVDSARTYPSKFFL